MVQERSITSPDITHLVTEDDTPVDNFQSAKQQRLLVEPLYSTKVLPQPFLVDANIGMFYAVKQEPIVPDVFLSLGVTIPPDWSKKENRSYFFWEFGKPPEVAIEIVSNREGGELDHKLIKYARLGVIYYAVFDPLRQIQESQRMDSNLLRVFVLTAGRYESLSETSAGIWLASVGLGLTLWEGAFETVPGTWLRWCDQAGKVILTGAERAEVLAARLRTAGIDPDELEG